MHKAQRKRERILQRNRRRLWRGRVHKLGPGELVCACGGHGVVQEVVYYFRRGGMIVEGPYRPGSAEHPVDADLILEDGRGCSAWHCGTFAVPARYHDQGWCRFCGFTHKDQIVQQLQRWQEPGERGTPGFFVRLGRDATYADRRSFYLQALRLARRAEPWVRKSFQRDLVRLRQERPGNV